MNTLEKHIRKQLDTNIRDFSYDAMLKLVDDVTVNKVKRKITRQDMLDSLFNSDTGDTHQHSDELMKLVTDEYQCNMVEISSGNGQSVNVWNYESESYDIYLSADGREGNAHNTNGLSDALVDTYEGVQDKNSVDIPAYQVVDEHGVAVARADHRRTIALFLEHLDQRRRITHAPASSSSSSRRSPSSSRSRVRSWVTSRVPR